MATKKKVSLLFLVFFGINFFAPTFIRAEGNPELFAPPTIHQSTTGGNNGEQFESVETVRNGNVEVESRSFTVPANNVDSLSREQSGKESSGNWFTRKFSGAWNWVTSLGQTKIQSPTLLAVSKKMQSIESSFGLSRIYGSNVVGVTKAFAQKNVASFFKNMGGVVLKTSGVIAGSVVAGVVGGAAWLLATGQAAALSASVAGAVRWVRTISKPVVKFTTSSWKWVSTVVPNMWKVIDKFTLSVTRVTNRVANAISKYIAIGGELSKTGDALAKTTRTWGKLLNGVMAGLFAVGSTLSTGALVASNLEKSKPPVETKTVTEKSAPTNKTSSRATGGTSSKTTSTQSKTSTAAEQKTKPSATTQVSSQQTSTQPKTDQALKIATPQSTTSGVKTVSAAKVTTGTKTPAVQEKANPTAASKSTPPTTAAKPSPVSLAGVTQATKALTSAVGKIGSNVSKVLQTEIPRFLSAGYYPSGQASQNPSAYQKATIITWASFAGALATSLGTWSFLRLRRNKQSEQPIIITES